MLTYLRKDGVRVDGRVPCSVWGLIGHVRLATESGGEREESVEGSRSVLTLLLIAEPIAIKENPSITPPNGKETRGLRCTSHGANRCLKQAPCLRRFDSKAFLNGKMIERAFMRRFTPSSSSWKSLITVWFSTINAS